MPFSLIHKDRFSPPVWRAMLSRYGRRAPENYTYVFPVTARGFCREVLEMPNLFPDMSREQYQGSEDFIFGAPIHVDTWNRISPLSEVTPRGVRYFRLPREATFQDFDITVLLRTQSDDDDRMLEAAAYLRAVKNNRDRIYAVPAYTEMDLHTALVKTIGAPRHLSVMFDLPKEKESAK